MCDDRSIRGSLYAIGLGPGDPDLLTVKAVNILKRVDRIIVPKARDKISSARDIVTRAMGENMPFHEMIFPMSRSLSTLRSKWEENASPVITMLDRGEEVAFVSLRDVRLYSTFSYLEQELKRKDPLFPIRRIPGISSVQLAAIRFEADLALGNSSYAVLPLPASLDDLLLYWKIHETLVILKVGERLNELTTWLKEQNLIKQASFIRRAGFPDEFIARDLLQLDEEEKRYLSIVMMKKEGQL